MKKIISLLLLCALILGMISVCGISVSAASYGDIYLRGTFNGWDNPPGYKMTDMGNGNYSITVAFAKGKYEYKFANADWSFNTPEQNATLEFNEDTSCMLEVNVNTGLYHVTPIKGETSMLSVNKELDKVRFTCAWAEHNDEILTELNGYLGYTTDKNDDKAYWDIVPTTKDKVYYIKNNKTQNFIYYSGNNILCSKTGNTTDAGKWYIDRSTGNYRIISYTDVKKSINLELQDGYAQYGYVPAFYTSSQFSAEFANYFYTLYPDRVDDTLGTASAKDGQSLTSNAMGEAKSWALSTDISSAPSFSAENSPLLEAVYNLSIEESILNQFESKYGTAFYTGVNWKKVWTRDTAMACQYSLANIYPQIALNCAKEKVVGSSGQETFEEDTGSGGSYPVSTDKIITMLSVWEIYLSTGDKSILEYFYPITKNTIEQDLNVAFDEHSQLFKGETCGTDWRDQTYPDWVSETLRNGLPNIAEGKAASVNIIYCRVLELMSRCADILGKDEAEKTRWQEMSENLEKSVSDRLYRDDMNLYAAWEYPSYMGKPLPFKADVISNGYATMFNIGTDEQIKSILENYPLVTYGAPTVYPQKQGTLHNANKVYHNRGVWPGWEATLMLGAAEHGYNELSEEIFNSCVRGAAEYLTNKEVIDFTTGEGIESDRQLWSIAATLSGYYKVLFGMRYDEDGLSFSPYIPSWCEGPYSLSSYPYRNATLDITLLGEGDTISSIKVDGESVSADYKLPADITGKHTVEIEMIDSNITHKMNLDDEKNHVVCPSMPKLTYSNGTLYFDKVSGLSYKLYDGTQYIDLSSNSYKVDTSSYRCYSLVAISADGVWSEMSEPLPIGPADTKIKIEAESGTYNKSNLRTSPAGYSGSGVVDDTMKNTSPVTISVDIKKEGTYLLSCIYNNKGEPTSSTNCAIRSVYVDGKDLGTLVFPVMNYYYQISTHLPIKLTQGTHQITVLYDTKNFFDRNMNIATNSVQYDYFILEMANDLFDDDKEYVLLGDSDTDKNVTIIDATVIQKVLAKYDIDEFDSFAADVDENGIVEIIDATQIQRYLANIPTQTRIGEWIEKPKG